MAIAGFAFSGCSSPNDDDDVIVDDDKGEDNNGNNNGGDVSKDKIVGCWYKVFIDYEKKVSQRSMGRNTYSR